MLTKLIGRDFRATARLIPACYLILTGIFAAFAIGFLLRADWLSSLGAVGVVLAAGAVVVVTIVALIAHFARDLYGAESYLTHTLPVSPGKLLLSKVTVTCFWMLLSALVALGALAGLFRLFQSTPAGSGIAEALAPVWNAVSPALRSQSLALLSAMAAIQTLAQFAMIFLAVALGNQSSFHRHSGLAAVVIYFCLYLVMQLVVGVFTAVVPLTLIPTADGWHLATTSMLAPVLDSLRNENSLLTALDSSTIETIGVGVAGFLAQIALAPAMFFATAKLLERKLSVK